MKLLFITQTAATDGGVERWLSNLCTGLAAMGAEVSLALVDGPVFHDADAYLQVFPEMRALPHVIVRSHSGTARGRILELERTIRDAQPDIVVPVLVHEAIEAVRRRRRAGDTVKLVYPIHENEVWAFNAVVDAADTIDACVSVNALMLQALREWAGWPDARAFHIRAGVEITTSTAAQKRPNNRLVIGYCGKLVENQKRAGDLVGFCQELDALQCNYELRIAGTGPEQAKLAAALARQVEDGRVQFLGSLDRAQLCGSFYPQLDALLITSDWETGPLVAWEAMMHGVAIVTSAYRGLNCEGLLRHDDNAMIFPVGEPQVAARLVVARHADVGKLQEMGQRAQTLARRELSHSTMIEQWMQALKIVMAASAALPTHGPAMPTSPGAGEWLHDTLRRVLARPLAHSNAHEEWPRYQSGWIPPDERVEFARRLDTLEASLPMGSPSPKTEGLAQHA